MNSSIAKKCGTPASAKIWYQKSSHATPMIYQEALYRGLKCSQREAIRNISKDLPQKLMSSFWSGDIKSFTQQLIKTATNEGFNEAVKLVDSYQIAIINADMPDDRFR